MMMTCFTVGLFTVRRMNVMFVSDGRDWGWDPVVLHSVLFCWNDGVHLEKRSNVFCLLMGFYFLSHFLLLPFPFPVFVSFVYTCFYWISWVSFIKSKKDDSNQRSHPVSLCDGFLVTPWKEQRTRPDISVVFTPVVGFSWSGPTQMNRYKTKGFWITLQPDWTVLLMCILNLLNSVYAVD